MSKSLAVAADVRTWLVAHPKTLARLSPAALRTVVPNEAGQYPKGRISPEAFVAFNKGQRSAEYVLGATAATVKAEAKAALKVRKAAAVKGARKGLVVGKRGPIAKSLLVTPRG